MPAVTDRGRKTCSERDAPMLILLLLMALILAVALWSYSYVWRGLNRRVIAAVKVVDPMITLGPYAMVAWVGLMGVIATNM